MGPIGLGMHCESGDLLVKDGLVVRRETHEDLLRCDL
jgi:hypothetical protein